MITAVLVALSLAIAILATWMIGRSAISKVQAANIALAEQFKSAQATGEARAREIETLRKSLYDLQHDAIMATKTIASLQAQLVAKEELLSQQKDFVASVRQEMEREFRILATTSLDQNAQKFSEQQTTKLDDLLKPFRENIESFRKDVEDKFREEGKEKSALQREIELLGKASMMLTKEAKDLTEALRGSTKQQGDWGEGILERILEHCGPKEGIDYTTQASSVTEDGTTIRPDVVLHLPGNRNLVIDSKVSLTHYWDMCASEDTAIQQTFFPLICNSLRQHIDGLYKKPYNEVKDTPDYLVMFVPVEAAYITALQHDGSLWKYAYDRNILLISPTNLIPFMRLVDNLWDRDKKFKNAEAIADKAGKLYDKLVGFIDSYEDVGKKLEAAQKSYDAGMRQLYTGKDNLITQAERMKGLNITAKKDLPESLVEKAALAEGIVLPSTQ